MKEIVKLDAEDAACLKSKYAFKTRMMEVSQTQRAGEFDKAEKLYEDIIGKLKLRVWALLDFQLLRLLSART